MTTRKRKEELKYRKERRSAPPTMGCNFCAIKKGHPELIEEGTHFKVIVNLYHYSYWDEQDVEHQVMLVPKKHVESIKKLPLKAATEFLDFIGKYEEQGYSMYARANESPTKSIPHQHTHLIKTSGKRKKLIIYSRKPFALFMR